MSSAEPVGGFSRDLARIADLLVAHCLVGTLARFRAAGQPYRFPAPETAYPGSIPVAAEEPNRNTALMICVDGSLPPPIRKHFRLRSSNRAIWRNIRRLLPDADMSEYRTTDNRLESDAAPRLLTQLLPLDYALLVERPPDESGAALPAELTHLHVKVERITDNAIRDLGRQLGYLQRSLFERGEDYVEALEAKFFEYHGFPAHASGRQAAAAMAAQLLRQHEARFTVFVASQESGRLTVLDETDEITQMLLVEADDRLRAALGEADPADYLLPGGAMASDAGLLRLRLRRTPEALPQSQRNRDSDITAPWLEIVGQELLPVEPTAGPPLPYAWSERRTAKP
ncbi:MAG: hypothetical protein RIM84_11805 [Alphaproteobacteria bacterium]